MTPWFLKRLERYQRPEFDWNRIIRMDPCCYCGRRFPWMKMTAEHVQPMGAGGLNVPENKVGACQNCNKRRGMIPLLTFFVRRRNQHAFLMKDHVSKAQKTEAEPKE